MLKGIAALLTPDLLYVLAAMGHGDELALVDRNFPAASVAGDAPVIELPGTETLQTGRAILSLLPMDTFVDPPVVRMQPVEQPEQVPEVQEEFQEVIAQAEGRDIQMDELSRSAFYDRAAQAFAVVKTGETRPYGCFLLIKGVIAAGS